MDESKNVLALKELVGNQPQVGNVLSEALAEISREDMESKKAKAKELVRQALAVKAQMEKAKKDFAAQVAKFDKELGKTLRQIQAMSEGKEFQEGSEES